MNGSMMVDPQAEPNGKEVRRLYDDVERLQNEKCSLADRSTRLLDREVKKLDIKMRELENSGAIAIDPQVPSLLRESSGNRVQPTSSFNTGTSTPLGPLSVNTTTGGAPHLINQHLQRISAPSAAARIASLGPGSNVSQMQAHQAAARSASQPTAISDRHKRETSVASESKRRKLTGGLGSLPPASSQLARHSSLGPGTPRPSAPGSRAGSAGPRPAKKTTSKMVQPHQQLRKKHGTSKKSRRALGLKKGVSPSTTGDDQSESAVDSGEEDEDTSMMGVDGAGDDEGVELDDEQDDAVYCY
ncbi:hypothetical protein LTS18_000618, partial [Coniosporium uncinatum]